MASAAYQAGDEVRSGLLYRRIPPVADYFRDGRPTSLNFMPDRRDGYVSMSLASETTIADALSGHDDYGLLAIEAGWLWGQDRRVIYEPAWGPGHVAVFGFTKKDERGRRAAAFVANVLVEPTAHPRP